jgi:neurofibromin 1
MRLLSFCLFFFLQSTVKLERGGSEVAKHTIASLSNLLAANVDLGLHYFVTMGYHQDFDTRTAFLKVLTNILSEG